MRCTEGRALELLPQLREIQTQNPQENDLPAQLGATGLAPTLLHQPDPGTALSNPPVNNQTLLAAPAHGKNTQHNPQRGRKWLFTLISPSQAGDRTLCPGVTLQSSCHPSTSSSGTTGPLHLQRFCLIVSLITSGC